MVDIIVMTGAGISAESGLGTFRDKGGIWSRYNLSDVASVRGFIRNPEKIHEFYNLRRSNCVQANPNEAHFALARLEQEFQTGVLIVTQNVDDLHQRAGSRNVLQMHGSLLRAKCAKCGFKWSSAFKMSKEDFCPSCGVQACRPDVVWFGESPYHMNLIREALGTCKLFVVIGSSGSVYPAAGFVATARSLGVPTLSINLDNSALIAEFDHVMIGPATRMVPRWVSRVLARPDKFGVE